MTSRAMIVICLLAAIVLAEGQGQISAQSQEPRALRGTLTVIGQGAGSPDDVAVAADGTIYFSDMAVNRVLRLNADGASEIVSPVIREPEGIVPLADGLLVVVEQATNRLYRVDPVAKTMSLFYVVGNATANAGIDGISLDGQTGDILAPDAPTGRILRLSPDGSRLSVLWSGFERPTSVALAADGTLFVCDEFGGKVYRITADGSKSVLAANLSLPDDVILDKEGHALVNSLDGTVWDIDPQTGRVQPLVVNLRTPHGIALEQDGSIIIADATLNQIFRLRLPTPAASQ